MSNSHDLLVNIDVQSAQAMAATSAYGKALDRLDANLTLAAKSQAKLDAALAASGAGSAEAALAQKSYEKSLLKVSAAEDRAAIAAKRSSEIQVSAAKTAAAAQEAASAKQAAALKKVGTIGGLVGGVAAVGLFEAAKAAAEFNSQLAQVKSLSGASAAQMQKLASAAGDFSNLGISATEAADAEIELTKAGLSAQQILGGGLRSSLLLAADGQMNVADATKIAASAMVEFKLPASEMGHVADDLAAGADKALGSVQDLGTGLTYAGLGAHQAGLSLDDTVGALAEFAQAGLIGAQGGTTLQQVLRQLLSPTAKAATEIKALGLNLYDSQGHFVGLASVAGQLQRALGGMSEAQRNVALGTLFTSRAVRGATILYQDGAAGVKDWVSKVNDSGFAAQQAAGKMDSLKGDVQKLGAAFHNDLIQAGQAIQPTLRSATQGLTSFLGVVHDIPAPMKEGAVEALALTAALGGGLFVYSRVATGITSLRAQLSLLVASESQAASATDIASARMAAARIGAGALGVGLALLNQHIDSSDVGLKGLADTAEGAAFGFSVGGPWGAAIGGAVGALVGFVSGMHQATAAQKAFSSSQSDFQQIGQQIVSTLNQETGAYTRATEAAVAKSLADKGVFDAAGTLGVSLQTVTQAALGNKNSMALLRDAYTRQMGAATALQQNFGGFSSTLYGTNKGQEEGAKRAAALTIAWATLTGSVKGLSGALDVGQRHIRQTQTALQDSADSAAHFNKVAAQMGGFGDPVVQGDHDIAAAADSARLAIEGLTAAQRQQDAQFSQNIGSVAALTLQIESSASATKTLSGVMNANRTAINAQSVAGATLIQNLSGIASAALAVKGGEQAKAAAIQRARQAIIDQSRAAGASIPVARRTANEMLNVKASAEQVAAAYNALPKDVRTDVAANGIPDTKKGIDELQKKYKLTPSQVLTLIQARDDASKIIAGVQAKLRGLDGTVATTYIDTVNRTFYQHSGTQLGENAPQHRAMGGIIGYPELPIPHRAGGGSVGGVGSGTSDSNLVWESRGEFMEPTKAVQKYGLPFFEAIRNLSLPAPRSMWASAAPAVAQSAQAAQSRGGGQTVIVHAPAAPSGPLRVEGTLSLDERGRVFLHGIAHAEVQGEALHNATLARMRR